MKEEGNKDMINIGIIRFNNGDYGGIEHQITNICSNMNKEQFKLHLITNQKTKFSTTFEKYGNVHYVDLKNIWNVSKQVEKIVKEQSISIIQSHMLRESYIGCLTKFRVKKLYHIFRVHTYINCSFISKFRKKLYHLLSFLLKSKVDLYLPINEMNQRELIKDSKINANKVKVVHNGVRSLEQIEKQEEFNKYNLAMIANFNYGKGQDIAIRALQILVKEDKRYNITFIGGESSKPSKGLSITQTMEELAKKLNVEKNTQFLGFVNNINEIIKDKDIIILPSYSEGTPHCLLEAMSIKKLVIASAVGGIPEFIHDSENGFLHDNKDYETLAEKIKNIDKMQKEELETICENGYKTWKNEYTVKKLCDYLSTLYQEKGVDIR